MRIRKEYPVLAAVILALVLYLCLRNPDRLHYRLPEIAPVPAREISKIEVTGKGGPVVLVRKKSSWIIEPKGFPADADTVRRMLETIGGLSVTALVSESGTYDRYDLDRARRIQVRAWSGDTLRRVFFVGKAAPSFRHTFVRLKGDDRVYHALGNFRGLFEVSAADLRDKTVFAFDRDKVREMEIVMGKRHLVLTRSDTASAARGEKKAETAPAGKSGRWKTADGGKVDETEVNRLISLLSDLRCRAFMEGRKKEAFTRPEFTVVLKGTGTHTFSMFKKSGEKTGDVPAVSSRVEDPFYLSAGIAGDITKSAEKILVPRPKK